MRSAISRSSSATTIRVADSGLISSRRSSCAFYLFGPLSHEEHEEERRFGPRRSRRSRSRETETSSSLRALPCDLCILCGLDLRVLRDLRGQSLRDLRGLAHPRYQPDDAVRNRLDEPRCGDGQQPRPHDLPATPHRTAESRRVDPTPTMAPTRWRQSDRRRKVTTFRSTMPEPTVWATPVPNRNAAAKLKKAARFAWREDTRRDFRRDRVGGVVKTVDVVEDERNGDEREYGDEGGIHGVGGTARRSRPDERDRPLVRADPRARPVRGLLGGLPAPQAPRGSGQSSRR